MEKINKIYIVCTFLPNVRRIMMRNFDQAILNHARVLPPLPDTYFCDELMKSFGWGSRFRELEQEAGKNTAEKIYKIFFDENLNEDLMLEWLSSETGFSVNDLQRDYAIHTYFAKGTLSFTSLSQADSHVSMLLYFKTEKED